MHILLVRNMLKLLSTCKELTKLTKKKSVETFSCNSNESDCMLDKFLICKSSVIIETLVSNEKESESDTSITLLTSHPMILVISVTLHFTVGKLSKKESQNQKLMSCLTMR